MSGFKITCPHCEAVMKSPKPVEAGKKIKCAKCGKVFTTSEPEEDVAPAAGPKKKLAAVKTKPDAKPAAKKPGTPAAKSASKAGTSSPTPAAPKKSTDDDEESGGTYSFVQDEQPPVTPPKKKKRSDDDDDDDDDEDEDEEDERTKQRKQDLEFALDTSIKDLRGPAQTVVIMPSNVLIVAGAILFFLSFGWILFMIWPFFFSENVIGPDVVFAWRTSKEPVYKTYDDLNDTEKKRVKEASWAWIYPPASPKMWEESWPWDFFGIPMRIALSFVAAIDMILTGIVAYGGVKMQMLESWGWAVAASIIAIVSVPVFGLLIGVWCILVLNNETVKAGFTYRAE